MEHARKKIHVCFYIAARQEALHWTCCIALCQQTVFLVLDSLNLLSRSWNPIKWFEFYAISLFWGKRGTCWGNQCKWVCVHRYSKMNPCPDFHFSFYWPWFVPLAGKNSELTGHQMGRNRLFPGFPWQKHVSLPFLNDLWWSSKSVQVLLLVVKTFEQN